MYATLLLALLLLERGGSIRIIELQVPGHAEEGGSALLGCTFDLEGEELYSLKWYKDNEEFYRYVPSNDESISYFHIPGVTVNLSRSSSNVIALDDLKREAAGVYRCEVSGEAPYFVTVSDEKTINIHLLPKSIPRIIGLQDEYQVGDLLAVNCTSLRSRPKAHIKWLVNDEPAPKEYLRGPWERRSRDRYDAKDTTSGLGFTLRPYHFDHGILLLKCQVAIAPLYQNEVVYQVKESSDPTTETVEDFERLNLYENTYVEMKPVVALSTKSDIEMDTKDLCTAVKGSVRILFICLVILYQALQ